MFVKTAGSREVQQGDGERVSNCGGCRGHGSAGHRTRSHCCRILCPGVSVVVVLLGHSKEKTPNSFIHSSSHLFFFLDGSRFLKTHQNKKKDQKNKPRNRVHLDFVISLEVSILFFFFFFVICRIQSHVVFAFFFF